MATYHHGDLRAAVLSAAWKMVEKEGVEGLSVREAARRAGVSHNAPYRHFAGRDALIAALVAEGFDELKKALNEAIRSGKPTLINAIIDETAGTESGRITSLNPQSAKKK